MDSSRSAAFGVLSALPRELGGLPARANRRHSMLGLEVFELELSGVKVLACASGVGKVAAARGACALVASGAGLGLLIVGVCGGLRWNLRPGDLLHCERAVQVDLALPDSREVEPDPILFEAWKQALPARSGWFLTADRPALSLWRRLRTARAFAGACIADMETAAAAAVARECCVPWAALRAVSDGMSPGGALAFRRHFPIQAPRAADSVPRLIQEWSRLQAGGTADSS